jgi:hypothetical protein
LIDRPEATGSADTSGDLPLSPPPLTAVTWCYQCHESESEACHVGVQRYGAISPVSHSNTSPATVPQVQSRRASCYNDGDSHKHQEKWKNQTPKLSLQHPLVLAANNPKAVASGASGV